MDGTNEEKLIRYLQVAGWRLPVVRKMKLAGIKLEPGVCRELSQHPDLIALLAEEVCPDEFGWPEFGPCTDGKAECINHWKDALTNYD